MIINTLHKFLLKTTKKDGFILFWSDLFTQVQDVFINKYKPCGRIKIPSAIYVK